MQFKEPKRKPKPALSHDETNKYAHRVPVSKNDFVLRKSKSFNGPETRYPQSTYEETSCSAPYKNLLNEFCIKNLNCFPEDINDMAKRIVQGRYIIKMVHIKIRPHPHNCFEESCILSSFANSPEKIG